MTTTSVTTNTPDEVISYTFTDKINRTESRLIKATGEFNIIPEWFDHQRTFVINKSAVVQVFLSVKDLNSNEISYGALVNSRRFEFIELAKYYPIMKLLQTPLDGHVVKRIELCIYDLFDNTKDTLEKQNRVLFWISLISRGAHHLISLLIHYNMDYIIRLITNYSFDIKHIPNNMQVDLDYVKTTYIQMKQMFAMKSKEKHKCIEYNNFLNTKTNSPSISVKSKSISVYDPSNDKCDEISESIKSFTPFRSKKADKNSNHNVFRGIHIYLFIKICIFLY